MLKVLKFGGSSLADAQQFAKVRRIVESDPDRRVVVVSAPLIALFLIFRNKVMAGVSRGGTKG